MYKFSLEKYKGKATQHTCPNCNQPRKFVRYVNNESGEYIADEVGRCNRQSKCGYHYKPREYFALNPSERNRKRAFVKGQLTARPAAPDFIAKEILEKRLSNYDRNGLVKFLANLFSDQIEAVEKAVRDYSIGTFEDGRTIFWQIDKNRKIRAGKLISYDEATGKRRKGIYPSWIHSELAKTGEVKKDFKLEQCFFGEHLATSETEKPIAIVEAEKTAVIASLFFPEMVWIATGGKSNLQIEKLKRLGRRTIILFPDADAFEDWQEKAAEAKGLGISIKVSSIIETKATDTDKTNGNDLADYLVEQQKRKLGIKTSTLETVSKPNSTSAYNPVASELELIFSFEDWTYEFEVILEERIAVLQEMHNLSEEEAESLVITPNSLMDITYFIIPF